MSEQASDPESFPSSPRVQQLMSASYDDLHLALQRAANGVSSLVHHLDETVVFMLDNHLEVTLRVRRIEVEYQGDRVLDFKVFCRTDFENVLILAKKLNMRIAAFATWFTVILSAEPSFAETWNEAILGLERPAQFFETLDELKRPIFLNLNHYIIARISD